MYVLSSSLLLSLGVGDLSCPLEILSRALEDFDVLDGGITGIFDKLYPLVVYIIGGSRWRKVFVVGGVSIRWKESVLLALRNVLR